MSDGQVWTLIGVFAASMFGVIGIITTSFTKTMNAGFEGVGYRIEAVESRLDAKIDKLDVKIDSMESRLNARIDTVESRLSARLDTAESRLGAKIDLLDRDISVIAKRVFPEEPT